MSLCLNCDCHFNPKDEQTCPGCHLDRDLAMEVDGRWMSLETAYFLMGWEMAAV